MTTITVGVVGASGETGGSIFNGLLQAGNFKIIALTRPSSMSKPINKTLQEKGVILRPVDLSATHADLVASLQGIEILISAMAVADVYAEIPLATAAKEAKVSRFVPCAFGLVIPAGGISFMRDAKEVVFNHIKALHLPYTIIDVGWWYQLSIPSLPSKRTQYMKLLDDDEIIGTGTMLSALTDLRDVGRYVARIVVDARTLNRSVFVYNEMHSQRDVYEIYTRVSGEEIVRTFVGEAELQERIAAGGPDDETAKPIREDRKRLTKGWSQFVYSWGIRGDNTPAYADYLGYLNGKQLYPDFEFRTLENFAKTVVEGKEKTIYDGWKAKLDALHKQ